MNPQALIAAGLYTLFFIFFIWYYFFFSPKAGSAIAADHGKDQKRWHFYIWAFGLFGILYLSLTLGNTVKREKIHLMLLMCGYLFIFIGAIALDALFWPE